MRNVLIALAAMMGSAAYAQEAAPPQFQAQEIDKSLTVGYGVRLADLNGDKKLDIVVADSARVIWFENGPWTLHTIHGKLSRRDNVCLAVSDIDGDGKPDIALGAEWDFNNTKDGGSLQWLRQGDKIGEPWQLFPILDSEPTLHRINFADVNGDGKAELVVGPLKGRGSTAQNNWADTGARLLSFAIPADPTKGPWQPVVLLDQLHVMHNFNAVDFPGASGGKTKDLLIASYEGVSLLTQEAGGKPTLRQIGAGDQADPKGARGSSEVKMGALKGGTYYVATIEPFHGDKVAVYSPAKGATKDQPWQRTVIDTQIKGGHALWCADLDGDTNDEIIVGSREPASPQAPFGVNIYQAEFSTGQAKWVKHALDAGGVAVEDLACGDLDGDGKVDIVAVGRATHNVKIYWNRTATPK